MSRSNSLHNNARQSNTYEPDAIIGNCEECRCEIYAGTEDAYWFATEKTDLCVECLNRECRHQRQHERILINSLGFV